MKKIKYGAFFCAALIFACAFGGCAAGSTSAAPTAPSASRSMDATGYAASPPMDLGGMDYAEEAEEEQVAYDMAKENPSTAVTGGDAAMVARDISAENRKIIYSVELSLQTTGFDEGVKSIPDLTEGVGGFVQDSYIEGTNMHEKYYSRSASFTVRIPADELDAFLTNLSEAFHVVYQQKHSSDITGSYYDTKARLDSLNLQKERLMGMLAEAGELQYMLEVERELANVLYEIEAMTSALNRMDSSVSMSTVSIRLQEVSAYEDAQPVAKPATFGERMQETLGGSWDGFVNLCQGFLLVLISLIPFLPLIAIIAIVIWIVVCRRKKSGRKAKQESLRQPTEKNDPENPL